LHYRWKYIVWNKWYINATGCLNIILLYSSSCPAAVMACFSVYQSLRLLDPIKQQNSNKINRLTHKKQQKYVD
jgi:hypothetical protein